MKTQAKSKPKIKVLDNDNICPRCSEKLILKWSGVKCSKCTYWFCY